MNDPRPDPDALLRRIKAQEQAALRNRGRLRVFLGANAGVGKTYRMLSQARMQKAAGVDVVVGIVETHGRKETESLIQGLEIVPRRKMEYSGIILEEMDIDALLQRRPKLALVDELAHTNFPGSRHNKRYQDVEELLEAGINVYTTLNVQHVESVNDTVYQITGVKINETVPDRILEMADDPDAVELVDLSPEELLQRLSEGKVYVPEKAKQAAEQFFRPGNLLALREMALRYTARLVGQDLHAYMELRGIQGPWSATTRILVLVGTSTLSQEVLRLAKQLASPLDAEWFAVHVQSPLQAALSQRQQEQLTRNLRLAADLGGKVTTLTGQRLPQTVLDFARSQNISLILVGWRSKWNWRRLFQGSLVDALVRDSGPIHVLVVTGPGEKFEAKPEQKKRVRVSWQEFAYSTLSVAGTAGVCWLGRFWLDLINVVMILLLPVVASGILWGKRAGLLASILAALTFDFFFVPPYHRFILSDLRFLPTFFVLFLVGITTSFLADMLRRQSENAQQSERFVSSLYELSRELMSLDNVLDLLQRAGGAISRAFNSDVQFMLPDGMGLLKLRAQTPAEVSFGDHEYGAANWVFQHGHPAGRGTETLSSSRFLHLPLKTRAAIVGVVGIKPKKSETHLGTDQVRLLESFCNIIAIAVARVLRLR